LLQSTRAVEAPQAPPGLVCGFVIRSAAPDRQPLQFSCRTDH